MSETQKKGDQNRRTPPWLFELLQQQLGVKFKVDLFASKVDALCKRYITAEQNALITKWAPGPGYGNPPFKLMGAVVARAFEQARKYDMLVALVGPTGCSQSWFHNYARQGTVWVPNRRIVFYDSVYGKPTGGADRDTMVYLFGPGYWNKGKGFKMETIDVAGKVVTSRNAA